MSETEVVQEQESVTFFSWMGNTPSSQVIHLWGGERKMDGGGNVVKTADVFADFHNGMFTTTDPEKIRILRGMARRGGITEDRDLFYRMTMSKDQALKHAANKTAQLEGELAKDKEEISRLRKLLEQRGGRKD
jgi:hypothetical protein